MSALPIFNSQDNSLPPSPVESREQQPLAHVDVISKALEGIADLNDRAAKASWGWRAKCCLGAVLGHAAEKVYINTGLCTALHEIVGHGYLGYALTHVSGAKKLTFKINSWNSLDAIKQSPSLQKKLVELFRWAWHGPERVDGHMNYPIFSALNRIGMAMGRNGTQAWTAIAGSLPELALAILSAAGGMLLREKSPAMASLLIAFGCINHFRTLPYPLAATSMSDQELMKEGKGSHDFAAFATYMGDILHTSPKKVAEITCLVFTLIVPAAILMAYLASRPRKGDSIQDTKMIQQWLIQAKTDPKANKEFAGLLASYPRKESLQQTLEAKDAEDEMPRFIDHLQCSAKEIASEWQKKSFKHRIKIALTVASAIGILIRELSKGTYTAPSF